MTTGQEFAERFHALLAADDLAGLLELYDDDAMVIRFNGAVTGKAEIETFLRGVWEEYRPLELNLIEQLRHADDVIMWDAMLNTSKGVVQVTETIILDDDGKIHRHIPGFRGYWGK